MNFILPLMIIISLIFACINGRLDQTISAVFSGAENAVTVIIQMAGVFCFWSGLLKISENSGLSRLISKIISPLLHRLFPGLKKDSNAFSKISMNVVANLLGMGNAATPAGIDAMCELDKTNGYSPYASDEMCMFVILNTASIQLIPTTIMSLRASSGGNPQSIIIPIWITSAISLLSALMLMKIIIWWGRKK